MRIRKEIIFVTGITGSVGSYLADLLIDSNYFIYALVRSPENLPEKIINAKNFRFFKGHMENIYLFEKYINRANYLIHIATNWCDTNAEDSVNNKLTKDLFSYLNPRKIKRIIYFSTASILGRGNALLSDACNLGTGYIKSKYDFYEYLKISKYKDITITLFPTMVIGGDEDHRYSHIGEAIKNSKKLIKFLRFFYVKGTFHFVHSKDLALITYHLLTAKEHQFDYVIGNDPITMKKAFKTIAKYFGYTTWFSFNISIPFIIFLAKIFRKEVKPWDKFCMQYKHFVYKTHNANDFGFLSDYDSLYKIMNQMGVDNS